MGDGSRFYENILSYTYTEPGEYLIITSARIDKTIGSFRYNYRTSPEVIAINGIRRDTISLEGAFDGYLYQASEFNPQNVNTSRVTSMKNAFRNCITKTDNDENGFLIYKPITVVDLSNWDVSNVTDMSGMFSYDDDYYKYMIKSGGRGWPIFSRIIFDGWDTSNVKNMSKMFLNYIPYDKYPWDYDEPINFSSWDTSNVTDMSEMFKNCNEFAYDIGHFNTKNVITFKDMFRDSTLEAKAYTKELIPGDPYDKVIYTPIPLELNLWDTSSATDMSGMFNRCSILESLDLSNWDVRNVNNMEEMFTECVKLISLNLRNWDISNVTNMNDMFSSCGSLRKLDLSGWFTSNVTDMEHMFAFCNNLVTLDIRNFDTSKATNVDYMLIHCYNLYDLRLDNCSNSTISDIINSASFSTDAIEGAIRIVHCKEENAVGLTAPENWMFSFDYEKNIPLYNPGEFENAETSLIKTRVDSSHTSLRRMCYGCTSLKDINVKNFDTRNVTDTSEMFSGCTKLSATIPNATSNWFIVPDWNTSNVTTMEKMFYNCSSINKLDLRNWDVSNVTNMRDTFCNCSSLNYLYLSNWKIEQDCDLSGMLSGCSNLWYLYLNNCDRATVEAIIYSEGFPTNKIYAPDSTVIVLERVIYVDSRIGTLTSPENWRIQYNQ
jgi:surface protein